MNEILLIVASVLLAWGLTGVAVSALSSPRHRVVPNERSMHTHPIPTGGGAAILATVLLLWPLWHWPPTASQQILLGLAGLLAAVSWVDDYRHLWPTTRFVVQAVAVAIALTLMPETWRVLPTLPLGWERVAIGIGWIWLINLTNFMDGIDGIAASETIAVTLGYLGVMTVAGQATPLEPMALVIAGASAGYLFWNWHPARIFMGDVGSIPLGFLLGWLMLDLASRGLKVAALILPMVFLADATITLLRRLLAGEKPWQAHRTHFYQRAVKGDVGQNDVVLRVVVTNEVLIVLALLSVEMPVPALGAAAAATLVLLASLEHAARGPSKTGQAASNG